MSSDFEGSASIPNDATLEKTLRDVVKTLAKESPTVNIIRTEVEERLGLDPGFFKTGEWKARSKDVITEAFDGEPASQPSPPPRKATKAKKPAPQKPAPKKRSSVGSEPNAKKRQKRAKSESDVSELSSPPDDEEDDSEAEYESPKPTKRESAKRKEAIVDSGSEDGSEVLDVPSGGKREEKEVKPEDGSESEMSDVLDEPPPKKRRGKSASAETKTKANPTKKVSAKAAQSAQSVSADEAEIKRLQGWLVKCGIRKLWHKELAPYDRPKAKINHLKSMLSDAGMVGRYSVEKAESIKEERELAADLEAVQEGAKKWGHGDEEGSGEEDAAVTARPRRRAAAASARFVDFGDSGEESD